MRIKTKFNVGNIVVNQSRYYFINSIEIEYNGIRCINKYKVKNIASAEMATLLEEDIDYPDEEQCKDIVYSLENHDLEDVNKDIKMAKQAYLKHMQDKAKLSRLINRYKRAYTPKI